MHLADLAAQRDLRHSRQITRLLEQKIVRGPSGCLLLKAVIMMGYK